MTQKKTENLSHLTRKVLLEIKRAGSPVRQKDLRKMLEGSIEPRSLIYAIQTLEEKGFIRKVPDLSDLRTNVLIAIGK